MNKGGRPKGSKNTPKRTLDLRDIKPEPEPKFKITSSQRKLLKTFNADGLPDFRSKDWKKLSYDEKDNYIAEQLAIAIENRKEAKTKVFYSDKINIYDEFYKPLLNEKKPNSNDEKEIDKFYKDKLNDKFLSVFYKYLKKYKGQEITIIYDVDVKQFLKNKNLLDSNYLFENFGPYENEDEFNDNSFNILLKIDKNFSNWWSNLINYSRYWRILIADNEIEKQFGYGQFSSDNSYYIRNYFSGNIYIYKSNIDQETKKFKINDIKKDKNFISFVERGISSDGQNLDIFGIDQMTENFLIKTYKNYYRTSKKQYFKEHKISNCLLEPIKQWAISRKEEAETKSTYYRYKKIEDKINNYIDLYLKSGVPQDEISNICNDLHIDISISLPLQKENKFIDVKSNSKPLKKFNFINTKFNHIDLDDILLENKFIELKDYKDLIKIKRKLDEDDKFYIYKMKNNKYTSIITNDGHYKLFNDFQDTINKFEIETGLNNCKICDVKDYELSKFVRDSCHYNCSLNFIDELRSSLVEQNEDKEIKHIDMAKAYANFKSCSFYSGFLGKITDFRKTNKIMGIGLYQINNIDFSKCDDKIRKLLLKLNIYHNYYIYTSPELEFLKSLNVSFDIIAGCWGHSSLDFDFNENMINKKDEDGASYYAKYCGFINSQFLNTNYYLKSCFDYNQILDSYGDYYDGITYLEQTKETLLTIKKKNNYHLSHINSFITSYQRINLIEQLQEINFDDLIKINVDCIYYYNNENLKLKNVFRHKEFKECKLNDCDKSLIPLFEEIENYKYSNIIVDDNYKSKINLGCGGSGKTTKELRDDGLIKKLFCPPSWKLARNKEKEENINVSVWYYITTKDPEVRNKILNNYNVLIIDEVSMMTEETKKFILEEFKLCKIIFCGDLGFQLPPINGEEMTIKGIEKIEYFKNNYRCKCPELLQLLNRCREMINDRKSLFFINNYIINFFKDKKKIINLEKLKEIYDINDMILSGTNELKDAYSNLFKGKFANKKFYITSNSRYYSNGEILITNEKPLGVSSDERYCYTTHSIQGETAYDKVFIDISKMFDERMFYTALSRAMYLEQIYLISTS